MEAAQEEVVDLNDDERLIISLYRSCSKDCRLAVLDFVTAASVHLPYRTASTVLKFPRK